MTVTASDIKPLILAEVGDFSDDYLASFLDAAWNSYADKAFVGQRLQELYTKRRLIDIALGRVRHLVDTSVTADEGAKLSEYTDHLRDIRKEVLDDIRQAENGAASGTVAKSGLLITVVPLDPTDGTGPADSITYKGSPYISQNEGEGFVS